MWKDSIIRAIWFVVDLFLTKTTRAKKRLFSKLHTKNNLFMLKTLTHKTHQYDTITMNLLYRTNKYSSTHNIRPEKQQFVTKTTPVKKVLWNRENLTLKGYTPGSNRKLNYGSIFMDNLGLASRAGGLEFSQLLWIWPPTTFIGTAKKNRTMKEIPSCLTPCRLVVFIGNLKLQCSDSPDNWWHRFCNVSY